MTSLTLEGAVQLYHHVYTHEVQYIMHPFVCEGDSSARTHSLLHSHFFSSEIQDEPIIFGVSRQLYRGKSPGSGVCTRHQ